MNELMVMNFDDETVSLIKKTVAKNADDNQLAMFLYQARKTGLDPLARQISCILRHNNKTGGMDMAIQTTIDGYRLIADRTGKYVGSDDYVFDEGITQYEHILAKRGFPVTATVTVHKVVSGMVAKFTATAAWAGYYPGDGNPGFMWRKFPYLMIGKCAEALALRKAFPNELSGLYTDDEMGQAEASHVVIETPKPVQAPTRAAVVESPKQTPQPPQNAPQVPQNANSTQPTTSGSNAPSATPPRPWDAQTLRSRIVNSAEKLGNGDAAEPAKRKACVIALAALTNHKDDDRHAITAYLFGKPSTKDLSKGEIESLIKWIDCDAENNPHPQAVAESRNVLAEYAAQQREQALPAQQDEDLLTAAGL